MLFKYLERTLEHKNQYFDPAKLSERERKIRAALLVLGVGGIELGLDGLLFNSDWEALPGIAMILVALFGDGHITHKAALKQGTAPSQQPKPSSD